MSPGPTISTAHVRLSSNRVVAVDALRGATIAFMILVNDPGDSRRVYAQLDHAVWNGWTLTDLVFPSFLFLVGCSIVFSVDGRLNRGVSKAKLMRQIIQRAGMIFLIKMALTAFPYFHMTRLRIFGVLTRIAVCYLCAGVLYLWIRRTRWLIVTAATLLLGYWVLLRWVHVPGIGWPVRDVPLLDPDRNLAAWIDRGFNAWCQRWLHTGVLYEKTRDPEGLLSTIPSVATTLIGVLAGRWLRSAAADKAGFARCRNGLLAAGALSLLAGELWNIWLPINKNLWTSSYVLLAGGWSLLALGCAYALLDVERIQERSKVIYSMLRPILVFGSNAITAFVVSNVIAKILLWWKVPSAGRVTSAWGWMYAHIFARGGSTANTSLLFAVAFVAVCFLPNWWLWHRKLFLRV